MEKYRLDHDLHIHSVLSVCSGDERQTPEAILAYGKRNGYHTLCLTDHCWVETVKSRYATDFYTWQPTERINRAKPLPVDPDGKCRFLFGLETDMDMDGVIGVDEAHYDDFDFIVVPTTHLNFPGFTFDPATEDSFEGRAAAWVRRFDAVNHSTLPGGKTGIAHLTCGLLGREREDVLKIFPLISDAEMGRLFTAAKEKNYGIELNFVIEQFEGKDRDIILRPYKIAKECGCKFYMGSDGHTPEELKNGEMRFPMYVEAFSLTEDDKYDLVRMDG